MGNADASRVAVFLSHERDSQALKAVLNNAEGRPARVSQAFLYTVLAQPNV